MSFAKLVHRFKEGFAPREESTSRHDPLRLATAAVLLEAAYADGTFAPAEEGNLVAFLERSFSLSAEEARELVAEADEIRKGTIDHFALTSFIRKNASLAERIDVVKTMWRMVYSDGRLTDYEGYLVRKLADLLGLEHRVMIDAKVSVMRELGVET